MGVDRAADVVPDSWSFYGGYPCLLHGGNYYQNLNHGPFYVNYLGASSTYGNFGCRILDKP